MHQKKQKRMLLKNKYLTMVLIFCFVLVIFITSTDKLYSQIDILIDSIRIDKEISISFTITNNSNEDICIPMSDWLFFVPEKFLLPYIDNCYSINFIRVSKGKEMQQDFSDASIKYSIDTFPTFKEISSLRSTKFKIIIQNDNIKFFKDTSIFRFDFEIAFTTLNLLNEFLEIYKSETQTENLVDNIDFFQDNYLFNLSKVEYPNGPINYIYNKSKLSISPKQNNYLKLLFLKKLSSTYFYRKK